MRKINKIAIAIILLVLSSCEKDKSMLIKEEKFKWLAEVEADKTAPMEVVYGGFIDSNGDSQWIPNGEYLGHNYWGNGGAIYVTGEEKRRIPERMSITWFSYAENKFYTGDFELPQEKIYDIFKKKYGEDEKAKYRALLLGIAPQGLITLWATGLGNKEIGTYQAHETFDEKWSDFSKNLDRNEVIKNYQKDMLPFVQEEIKQGKINNTYFKNRLQRYQYTIGTNRPDFKIYDFWTSCINNEVASKENSGLVFLTDVTHGKGIAKEMVLYIESPLSPKLEVRIDIGLLDGKVPNQNLEPLEQRAYYNQLMNRFKTFFKENKEVQVYIKFDDKIVESNINKPVYSGKVCLKSPTQEVEIPNSKVEVYYVE